MTKHHKTGSTAALHDKFKSEEPEMTTNDLDMESPEYALSLLSHDELLQACLAAQKESQQAQDRLLRQQADINNVQKRTQREVTEAHKYALEKFARELLPVIDSLERAVTLSEEHQHSVLEGVNMTLEMFANVLNKFGIEQVDPLMQAFNPELHQAVSTQVDPAVQPGTILNVLQKGYLLNGRLVRPALVIVSKAS